ncbi:MAG: hypothetical protein BM557_06960 [Flavobacterium sp. MedPE-SWcel]|uniref:hypothetical protein n=1 Tax=uncultured Flavobacterium sp. TaxID=165435 RepID=UPI0009165D24|nr:hypothetical protein [uncultured Flavobacterium sp.]OIQ18658.1 MAG: hypothetical protein BM557_06960 [Flavobacterium sp. MedPE-SWcel]
MKFFIYTFLLLLAGITAHSQVEAKTKDGRDVILNNNGTWIYTDSLCNYFTHTKTYTSGKSVTYANNTIKIKGAEGKTGLEVMLMKTSQSVVMNITILDDTIWCVDENTQANITFTNGKKIVLQNMGEDNCEGNFSCFLSDVMGNKKELGKLTKKMIKSISISYAINNSETSVTNTVETIFNTGEAYRVKTIVTCLSQK